jgi:hypothetical protein
MAYNFFKKAVYRFVCLKLTEELLMFIGLPKEMGVADAFGLAYVPPLHAWVDINDRPIGVRTYIDCERNAFLTMSGMHS